MSDHEGEFQLTPNPTNIHEFVGEVRNELRNINANLHAGFARNDRAMHELKGEFRSHVEEDHAAFLAIKARLWKAAGAIAVLVPILGFVAPRLWEKLFSQPVAAEQPQSTHRPAAAPKPMK